MNKEKITNIKKDNLDRIIEFKTDKGNIYNYEMAKEAITNGIIVNAHLIKGKDTLTYIVDNTESIKHSFENTQEF